jgi:hypothetical protein
MTAPDFAGAFAALREILRRHSGNMVVLADRASDYSHATARRDDPQAGGKAPAGTPAAPVAWTDCGRHFGRLTPVQSVFPPKAVGPAVASGPA